MQKFQRVLFTFLCTLNRFIFNDLFLQRLELLGSWLLICFEQRRFSFSDQPEFQIRPYILNDYDTEMLPVCFYVFYPTYSYAIHNTEHR